MVARGEVIRDLRQARDRLLSPGFDPRTTVVVDDMSPLGNPKGKPPANAGWVRWLPGTSDRPAMDVMLTEHGWLVLSDFYYPGWLAWVDGKIVPLYRANVAGRAAPVPAGRHRVEFTYEPQSLQQGIALSAISLALLLGGLLAVMPRAKTK